MHIIHRNCCRVCGSKSLKPVIDLGDQYLQGSFLKEGKENPPLRKIPTRLVRCNPEEDENACGLLQLEHTLPPEILYAAYWYRSGTNQTMTNHLKGIVHSLLEIKIPKSVLDIGCNDGTMLNFYPNDVNKFGVDPSDVANAIDADVDVTIDTFPSPRFEKNLQGNKIDFITSIACFYDLEDPVSFARAVERCLADDGIWVFEMSYMPTMLEKKSYDTICHEHLEYYSLAVLERILQMSGLKLFKASLNEINGGSIRCYAAKQDCLDYENKEDKTFISNLRIKEFDLALDTDKPYKEFQDHILKVKEDLIMLIKDLKRSGKTIHVYGASTKGNTILQWCGIDHTLVDCASDRNPDKDGARTIGTDIPIVSEMKSRKLKPDYYLVLPWHFRDEFIEREKDLLEKGTAFIFPLPEVEIFKK